MRHREVSLASAYCRGFFCFEGEKEKKALPQRAHRLGWIGGKFEDQNERGELVREVVELRSEPRYPQVNRWHVERWVPAEAYGSPRAWYAQTMERADGKSVAALGPYPVRGSMSIALRCRGRAESLCS
jgi:hypothetical protein